MSLAAAHCCLALAVPQSLPLKGDIILNVGPVGLCSATIKTWITNMCRDSTQHCSLHSLPHRKLPLKNTCNLPLLSSSALLPLTLVGLSLVAKEPAFKYWCMLNMA